MDLPIPEFCENGHAGTSISLVHPSSRNAELSAIPTTSAANVNKKIIGENMALSILSGNDPAV